MIAIPCRYCVAGFPDSFEVGADGTCVRCHGSQIDHVTVCDGCDDEHPDLSRYVVTFHEDGGQEEVVYCGDCYDLARMDWNGETASVVPVAPMVPCPRGCGALVHTAREHHAVDERGERWTCAKGL